jgi:hypothetical protein
MEQDAGKGVSAVEHRADTKENNVSLLHLILYPSLTKGWR